jgi:hypothetical protein
MNELLRYWAFKLCGKGEQEDAASDVMTAAATEIERLRAENARLREALEMMLGCYKHHEAQGYWTLIRTHKSKELDAARAALEVKP